MKPNWNNQSVFIGDNIDIMRAMNTESVDQICTDPPFNKNKRFDHVFGGKKEKGFDDAWTMDDERKEEFEDLRKWKPALFQVCRLAGLMHSRGMQGYLVFMATRLIECHRLLKETGSMYLHCDHSANAYLRMLMDGVFGQENFRNEIVWSYGKTSNAAAKKFLRGNDTILFYCKNAKVATFNPQFETRLSTRKQQLVDVGYNTKNMNGQRYLYIYDEGKVEAKIKSGKIEISEFDIVRRVDTTKGNALTTVWEIDHLNSQSKEKSGWATQKPLKLYSRMIEASSNPGDVVFDPFCGCATTLVAAENAGRQWVGIDRHPEAEKQVVQQLTKLNEGSEDWMRKVNIERKPPKRQRKMLTAKQREQAFRYLFVKQDGKCLGCGHAPGKKYMHIDHDRPIARGGDNDIGNLQLLCGPCNIKKGKGTMEELLKKLGKE